MTPPLTPRPRYLRPSWPAPADGHRLVAVDPGGRLCAAATWRVRPDGVDLVRLELATPDHLGALGADYWVVEVPHIRGDRTATVSGVEALERTVEALKTARRPRKSRWTEVRPSAWKGNVPKRVHHARVLEVVCAISSGVRGAVDPDSPYYNHNLSDAAALGLWALGLVGRGGVRVTPPDAPRDA